MSQINVVAGEKYIIVVSNYATSTSGFDIIFGPTSSLSYGGSGSSSINWSGGVDTDWFKKENWGGCAIPSCSLDAIVNGGIILQPTIAAPANAKSVIINPGAILTLGTNKTLTVCENFTNLGSFDAKAGSTVIFNNSNFNQNIDGNLLGTNAFANVTVTKTGGAVKLFKNTEMKGDFMISNGSSAFTANNKLHFVGGDFTNNGTYLSGVIGSLELNGVIPQDYYNLSTLNHVVINNSDPTGVTIYSDLEIGNNGSLTLTNGKINTTPFTEVRVLNRTPASVSAGNSTSFINGPMRRRINPLGSYDFPVGHFINGYQLANINYNKPSSPTINDNIVATFQTYAVLPPPTGATDCGIVYSSPPLDNGKWNFVASDDPFSGEFQLTLHNTNYTNPSSKYTIMNDNGGGWMIANGNCAPSIVTAVVRTDIIGLLGDFGTAQAPSLLPIELLSINAKPFENSIRLNWITATEKENRGFEVQRSDDGGEFIDFGWKDGAGTTLNQQSYTYDDINVTSNVVYYYRLHQFDFNGQSSYSPIVSCELKGQRVKSYVFPNPVTDESILTYSLEQNSSVQISLVNTLGEEIIIQPNTSLQTGLQHLFINKSRLGIATGLYTLKISVNGKVEILKILLSAM